MAVLKHNGEKLLLAQKTFGVCWAQQRGTELRARAGTWSRNAAPAPGIPNKSLNREIQSLNMEINPMARSRNTAPVQGSQTNH